MGYTKHETIKKQRKIVSKSQRMKRKVLVNIFKFLLVGIITVIIAVAGAGFGMIKGILDNAPDISEISIMPKGFKSYIYDTEGNVVKEISTIDSNRVYVYYEDIPEDYVNAFVAIEDERFWTHNGIDVKGIFRAFVNGLASGSFDQGASTLTQQLIKNHVFNVGLDERTFMDRLERKIQEQYLALELEKKYTKEQIVEYYLNTIYLGRGVHGIQSASEKYFGKDMTELTVSEIAVIAAITQNPSKYDPVTSPEQNAERRELVLDKMLELNYITKAEYETALADDVYKRIDAEHEEQVASYAYNTYYEDAILDALEKDFMEIYGCSKTEASTLIYTGGYSIYSVQDYDIQEVCNEVINDPDYVSGYDNVGLQYALTIKDVDGVTLLNYDHNDLIDYFSEKNGDPKYNIIYSDEAEARAAIDEYKEYVLNETGGTYYAETIAITPQPQFSFTIIDQSNGYVMAMVGGRGDKDVNRGLNRATDSTRQPGSTFKPLAAYTPLLDTGMGGIVSSFKDEEYRYYDGTYVSNWWGEKYRGYVTVRQAIEDSMNVIAVKAITKVTPEVAFEYLLDYGFTTLADGSESALTDITQSCALGGLSYGVTTLEMTAAYAAIANQGIYTKPVLYSKVVDHDGNVVIDNTDPANRQRRIMKETTSWQLVDAMRTTMNSGTGYAAKMTCGLVSAGKTGTTSSNYDLWFCGMNPYFTSSIWMGYDMNVNMGSSSAHKYMWRDINDKVIEVKGLDTSATFPARPDGITTATVCQISGKSPTEGCPTFSDYCATDSLPGGVCEGHEYVEFCADSKMIATEICPNKVKYVVEEDAETGEVSIVGTPDDWEDVVYDEEATCTMHPDDGSNMATVIATAGQGGTISNSVRVEKGSSVTVYISPFTGFSIADVTVNGVSVGPVKVYTFTDIQGNVTINATFKRNSANDTTTEAPVTEAPTTTEAPETEAPTTTEEPITEAPTTP
ncbi:MAG: hypothetical protein E7258_00790 [Lachnospiraceae bacterium]|nr:hypothetical protein [Lachnospiraceae bacterium]